MKVRPATTGAPNRRKVFRGNMDAQHLLRMVATREIHPGAAQIVGRDLLKDAGLLMPDVELRGCSRPETIPGWLVFTSCTSDCGSG